MTCIFWRINFLKGFVVMDLWHWLAAVISFLKSRGLKFNTRILSTSSSERILQTSIIACAVESWYSALALLDYGVFRVILSTLGYKSADE